MRIKDLGITATEADLVSGKFLAIDGSAGSKKLPCNSFAKAKYGVDKIDELAIAADSDMINGNYIVVKTPSGPKKYPADRVLTGEDIDDSISEWLDNHPEATTTVEDHSITYEKLVNGTLNFVTPEMYGAKGDAVTDDSAALSLAFNSGFPVYLGGKTYRLASELSVSVSKLIVVGGTLKMDSHDSTGYYTIVKSTIEDSEFEFINVKFKSTMDQTCFDDREYFFTEVPVSNVQAFTNLQTMKLLCFVHCKFINVDFPIKLISKVEKMVFSSCSFENFLNGIYGNNVDEFIVDSCHFYELPQAAIRHHGIYFQGSGKLIVKNCYMDCVNFCLHGWTDSGTNDRRIECIGSFLSGASVITNGGSSNKTIITNCDIIGTRIFYLISDGIVTNCSIDYRYDFADGSHVPSSEGLAQHSDIVFYNSNIGLGSNEIGTGQTLRFMNCAVSLKKRSNTSGANFFYCGGSVDSVTLIFSNCSIVTTHSSLFSLRGTNCIIKITNCSVDAYNYVFESDTSTKDIKTSTIYCMTGHLGYATFVPADNNSILIES